MLSSGPGDVDVAVLGRDRTGLSGDGVIAMVTFRASAGGDPRIGIASVDARDRANRPVELATHTPAMSLASGLAPALPNPFVRSATFRWTLGDDGPAELAVFSVDGRRVRTLFGGVRAAGSFTAAWDGTDEQGRSVGPGLYFARLVTVEGRFSRTVVKKTIDSMQSYLSEDASSDANLGPAASIAEFKIRSVMCVPLVGADGKAVGAVQLDTQDRAKKFKEDDLKLLTAVASLMSAAVNGRDTGMPTIEHVSAYTASGS